LRRHPPSEDQRGQLCDSRWGDATSALGAPFSATLASFFAVLRGLVHRRCRTEMATRRTRISTDHRSRRCKMRPDQGGQTGNVGLSSYSGTRELKEGQ
jgi:hypothetical protein